MEMSFNSKNSLRSETRNQFEYSELVLVSQQTCSLDENENLSAKIDHFESKDSEPLSPEIISRINNLKGLRAVFQILMSNGIWMKFDLPKRGFKILF